MTEALSETGSIHICPDCQRDFKTHSALLSHQKTHRVMPEPPHEMPTGSVPQMPTGTVYTGTVAMVGHEMPTGSVPQMPTGAVYTGTVGVVGTEPDVVLKLKKLPHYGALPDIKQATAGSAGFDLYAAIQKDIPIAISEWQLIPTGLCLEIPFGWVGLVVPRSGLAAKEGITILNTPGIIDSDYRGEVKVNIVNNTTGKFKVTPGMRIGQLVIMKQPSVRLEWVDELSDTARGTGGFGSTGR